MLWARGHPTNYQSLLREVAEGRSYDGLSCDFVSLISKDVIQQPTSTAGRQRRVKPRGSGGSGGGGRGLRLRPCIERTGKFPPAATDKVKMRGKPTASMCSVVLPSPEGAARSKRGLRHHFSCAAIIGARWSSQLNGREEFVWRRQAWSLFRRNILTRRECLSSQTASPTLTAK